MGRNQPPAPSRLPEAEPYDIAELADKITGEPVQVTGYDGTKPIGGGHWDDFSLARRVTDKVLAEMGVTEFDSGLVKLGTTVGVAVARAVLGSDWAEASFGPVNRPRSVVRVGLYDPEQEIDPQQASVTRIQVGEQ